MTFHFKKICIGLLRVYQTVIVEYVMEIKVVKNMVLHASNDILALLEESRFQTRK